MVRSVKLTTSTHRQGNSYQQMRPPDEDFRRWPSRAHRSLRPRRRPSNPTAGLLGQHPDNPGYRVRTHPEESEDTNRCLFEDYRASQQNEAYPGTSYLPWFGYDSSESSRQLRLLVQEVCREVLSRLREDDLPINNPYDASSFYPPLGTKPFPDPKI
jgi:hypothetical protein